MKLAVYRLALTLALFAGWLGYLGYQVATRPETSPGWPLVLYHPQILASSIDVIAFVPDKTGKEVTIKEILYPESGSPLKVGDKIHVLNIAECHPTPKPERNAPPPPDDWSGPGDYLLPLRALPRKNTYEVVPVPSSPGHLEEGPPHFYPDTPEARAQYDTIKKPEPE